MQDWVSLYAAIVATLVATIQFNQWKVQRVSAKLSVSPRFHPMKPSRCGHIEIDIQATQNPISICGVYMAAYKSKIHYILGREPKEIIVNEWHKIFPRKIEPGQGWEGLMAINDKERALVASHSHVRVMVRHTGLGRIVSKPITKYLRT